MAASLPHRCVGMRRRPLLTPAVFAAMAHLPEQQQQVLRLRFRDGSSSAQIADALGYSAREVAALQSAGLEQNRHVLRRRLTG